MSEKPTLAVSAHHVASILSAIVQMSDDVKNAASPFDARWELLKMQNSIQKNAARIAPYIKAILDAVDAEGES